MKSFLQRVGFALQGWRFFFSNETNGRIQAVVGLLVIAAGFVFEISKADWLWILLCIGLVIVLEMVNTALRNINLS